MILTRLLNKSDDDRKDNLCVGMLLGMVLGLLAMVVILLTKIDSSVADTLLSNIFGVIVCFFLGIVITRGVSSSFNKFKGVLLFIIMYFSIAIPPLFTNYYPSFIPVWFLIIVVLLSTELLFWLTPTKKTKKKQNTFGKTILLKLECLLEACIFLNILNLIRLLISKITLEVLKAIWNWIIHTGLLWAGYIVGGIIALGIVIFILYLWVKLNERKFKK